MARLAGRTRASVWNMQRDACYATDTLCDEVNERDRQRGIESRRILCPETIRNYPLVTSKWPRLRVAPVFIPLIVVDAQYAVLPGASSSDGTLTAWFVTDSALCREALALWGATWSTSVPATEVGAAPPLTHRQVQVAKHLMSGAKDSTIARELGVSPRTVASDAAHLLTALGASTRAEAVAIINGVAAR